MYKYIRFVWRIGVWRLFLTTPLKEGMFQQSKFLNATLSMFLGNCGHSFGCRHLISFKSKHVHLSLVACMQISAIWNQAPDRLRRCNQSSDVEYSIHNSLLPVVREVVDLGVTLTHSLSLSQHIAKLSVKGHRVANLISKCFLSRDVNSLVKAFITYVRPRLEYCSVAWNLSLKKDIESLEKVQWRFTRSTASYLLSAVK